MLDLTGVHSGYDRTPVLHGVSLTARPGEILCLLGRNGAGKTTTLKTIMGLLRPTSGSITLDGEDLTSLPAHQIPRRRIGYIPQGRRLFTSLTVAENLDVALMACNEGPDTRAWVLDIFPRLADRLNQRAGTLSGGEQQMLATARALCLRPRVLLLDEPSEGLQPAMIDAIRQVILYLRREGVAIILVEQRLDMALGVADHIAFLQTGRNLETLSIEALRRDPARAAAHLGV